MSNLARFWAIRAGITQKRTIPRTLGSGERGPSEARTREELAEAFAFLWDVRLRGQADRLRDGEQPDDFVDPHELGSGARGG